MWADKAGLSGAWMTSFFDRSIRSSGHSRREERRCLAMSGAWASGPDSSICDFPSLSGQIPDNCFVSPTPLAFAEVTGCSPIANTWQFLLMFKIVLHFYFYVDMCTHMALCIWGGVFSCLKCSATMHMFSHKL